MKYIYVCQCGYKCEKNHSMKKDPIFKCPKCKKKMNRKIFSPPLHFKGPGFYCTDNKKIGQIHPEASKAHKEGKI